MESPLRDRLQRAAELTFEELAFLFTDFELSPPQRAAPFCAGSTICFSGPYRGQLVVHLYGDLLQTIAANMMGEDEPVDASLQADSLKEITNVICGNLLPMIAGPDAVFQLDPPSYLNQPGQAATLGLELRGTAAIGLEAGRAELMLYTDVAPEVAA